MGRGRISVVYGIGGERLTVWKEMIILETVKLVECLNISEKMTTPQTVFKLFECSDRIVV